MHAGGLMDQSTPNTAPGQLTRIRLTQCPRCGYSLQGLGDSGNCPECGLDFDPQTIVIKGIPRAISTTPLHRKILWLIVIGIGTFMPQLFLTITVSPSQSFNIIVSSIGCAWVAIIVYLLMTGKRERSGTESFIFSSAGFGIASHLHSDTPGQTTLNEWQQVRTYQIDRLGSRWHRFRIAESYHLMGHLGRVLLDANLFVDVHQAQQLEQHVQACLRNAHEKTPDVLDTPGV